MLIKRNDDEVDSDQPHQRKILKMLRYNTKKEPMNLYPTKKFKDTLYEYCEQNDLVPTRVIERVITDRVLSNFISSNK